MPFISVIVPVYNAEKSIEKCARSITEQEFTDLELILVDDGSKDASGTICDNLAEADNRIRVIHRENSGVSDARNTGMEASMGKYILFVDSDDYLPKRYIGELVQVQKESGEDAFCWTAIQIESSSVAEEHFYYAEEAHSEASRCDVLKFSARYLLNSPVNKLYHGDVIRKHHLCMDRNISIAEDLLFNLRYLDAAGECPVVILNQMAYRYVRNGLTSLDSGYRKDYYEIHKVVLGKLWKYARDWKVPKEDIPLFYKRYWEYMQSAFTNLDCADCSLSRWQKFAEKSRITADRHFQKSLCFGRESMGKGSYLVWRSRIYLFVWLYEKIRKRGSNG